MQNVRVSCCNRYRIKQYQPTRPVVARIGVYSACGSIALVLDKITPQVTYVYVRRSIALDLHQIRPARGIRPASLGKLAAATCEHMIVDGRTDGLDL